MYNEIDIYQLRVYARNKGVRCPTKLKKADLIKQIKMINSGKQEPYFRENIKGRPPKLIIPKDKTDLIIDNLNQREKMANYICQINKLTKEIAEEFNILL